MKKSIPALFILALLCYTTLWAKQPYDRTDSSVTSPEDTLSFILNEIIVNASIARDDAPLTLNTLKRKDITQYIGSGTYPEILRNIGGIYATSESGSYGDAKINIRGFKQENFSVMLNGLPLSGIRSGSLFWNNWLGLTEATQSIQVQKGIGQSMLASNSLGGSINIITLPAEQPKSIGTSFSITDYGLYKVNIALASGALKNGWAVSFVGSHSWGKGYVDATDVNSWSYFLTVSNYINPKHSLILNILGSPERHQQRSQKLSSEEVEKYGLRYNKNWGYHNGKVKNISENFYHKPYITLDYFYTPTLKLKIATTAYFTTGKGGGKWTETSGQTIMNYRKDGLIDWNAVYAANENNTDPITLPDGTILTGASKNIQSDYRAGHTSFGLKSTVSYSLDDQFSLSGGAHYQYFYSWQDECITDLLGGDFWFENYEKNSLAGWADRNPIKYKGDFIRLDNGSKDHLFSVFAQLNQQSERMNAFIGGLFMVNAYQRWDKYNYIGNTHSDVVTGKGGTIKAGVIYKITPEHQVYLNGGFYSRIPYSNVYFSMNNNNATPNVTNEKNYMLESGYRFERPNIQININAYYNYWKNKSLMSNPYKPLDSEEVRYMIKGLDAEHMGVELNYNHSITTWLTLSAFGSLGHWKWRNDVDATIYDPYSGQEVETIRVYADGLYVGDAPQTQSGASASFMFFNALECRVEYRYTTRMYANFDPAKRTDPNDHSQSYRIPESHLTALFLNYSFSMKKVRVALFASCNNLFNVKYIERGDDGKDHDLSSFRGFWGIGRNLTAGLRIQLM
jgi:hypothetical protein